MMPTPIDAAAIACFLSCPEGYACGPKPMAPAHPVPTTQSWRSTNASMEALTRTPGARIARYHLFSALAGLSADRPTPRFGPSLWVSPTGLQDCTMPRPAERHSGGERCGASRPMCRSPHPSFGPHRLVSRHARIVRDAGVGATPARCPHRVAASGRHRGLGVVGKRHAGGPLPRSCQLVRRAT